MNKLTIYRQGNPTLQVNIDEGTVYTHEVIGVHQIVSEFISATPLDIRIDDYIMFRNERYTINTEFEIEKVSNFEYRYNIVFEHQSYWLKDKIFMHLGSVEFSYFGQASNFVDLVVQNMNEDDTGWAVGNVDPTDERHIEFYGDEKGYTCKGALMKVAEEFKLEFWVVGKTINMTSQAGVQTNLDFEYGRTRGLYSLTRGALETPLYNRIYGFGGTQNISFDYRNGAKRLVFADRKIELPLQPGERRRETSVIFDNIYPQRTGTISNVSANMLSFRDNDLSFNINDYLIEGETAKVIFKSGELSGYEYEIANYDHGTKTITIIPFTEPDGYTTPNSTFEPKNGDKYTLVNIKMPQSYISTAENELREATEKVFNQITRPPYEVEIDEKYMRDNNITLNAGDRVNLRDAQLGIDDMIRVFSVSFPLVNQYQLTAVISDSIIYRKEVIQEIEQEKIKTEVVQVDRTKAELARRNMLRMRNLQNLIYDPDGYFDMDNIRPGSIETGMVSVGVKSQNFGLNGVEIEPNYQGNPNSLRMSGGQLIHFEIEIPGLGYIWEINPTTFNTLVPGNSYYVYARCSKTSLSGNWFISTEPYQSEQETGYYHFWLGIVYAEQDGVRYFQFTKGMTFIVGDTITTGRIQSLDGLAFFDLSQGTFKIGDEDQSIDWGVTSAGQLTINGVLVTKMQFAENAEIINLLVKNLRTNETGKRVEILESTNTVAFYNANGDKVVEINDTLGFDILGAPLAGVMVENNANGRRSYLAASGIISNASLMPFFSSASGITTNASVAAILNERNNDNDGISAAVAGVDNTSSGNSRSFGGYFNSALIDELETGSIYLKEMRLNVRQLAASATLNVEDVYVSCYNTSAITVTLPSNPKNGKTVYIRRNNSAAVTIDAGNEQIIDDGNPQQTVTIPQRGDIAFLTFDGQYWCYNGTD